MRTCWESLRSSQPTVFVNKIRRDIFDRCFPYGMTAAGAGFGIALGAMVSYQLSLPQYLAQKVIVTSAFAFAVLGSVVSPVGLVALGRFLTIQYNNMQYESLESGADEL